MDTEAMYDQSLSLAQVARRRGASPSGMPTPTGYYPHVRGHLSAPVVVGPCYDDLYRTTVVGANDPGERIDQHAYAYVAQTWTPPRDTQRPSGIQDPATDGPPQPSISGLSLHYRRQAGASVTQYYDAPGHTFPRNGSQDGAAWTFYQDVTRALMPYDPAQTVNGQMPDTLRALPPSPPHGWAVRPLISWKTAVNAKTAVLTQQQAPKAELLANSTYAGQTYSQTTARAGAGGGATFGTVHSRRGRG